MEYLHKFIQEFRTNAQFRRYFIIFLLFIGIVWFVPPVWRLNDDSIDVTRWINKAKGKVVAQVGPKERSWTRYNRISRHTINAVIVAEDGNFYHHHGLDLAAIADSFKLNWRKGRYARGGSTITQQLIKMAFLSRNKNILRKAREATGALLVEAVLDKKQILEWYLNMVEFGDGVYGLDAAARHYFGSKPELLTTAQSIHLALVLPNPTKWSAGLRKRTLTPFGHRRFAAIVSNMYRGGYITKEQWISSLASGNFGAPIAGYQSVVAQQDSANQGEENDPRFMAPAVGEQEDVPDPEMDDGITEESNPTSDLPSATPSPVNDESPVASASAEAVSDPTPSPSPDSSTETPIDSPTTELPVDEAPADDSEAVQ